MDLFTVIAQSGNGKPYTIGTYSTEVGAKSEIARYFGTRARMDMDAVPHCLSCIATYRVLTTTVWIVMHELDGDSEA